MLLEPLVVSHAQTLYPLLQDARLYTYIPEDPPASVEALATRYRRLEARRSPDGQEIWLNWAARLTATNDYVGTFQATTEPDQIALLAYMVFPQWQGRGYAREGCTEVLEYLAREHGVRLVVAEIDTRNRASFRLVESLGFARWWPRSILATGRRSGWWSRSASRVSRSAPTPTTSRVQSATNIAMNIGQPRCDKRGKDLSRPIGHPPRVGEGLGEQSCQLAPVRSSSDGRT
jgi:RimJ/RimL family protein N-acetyltransferase